MTSCSACAFFYADKTECRRNAPAPQGHRQFAQWPKVKETDGCGEFSPASGRNGAIYAPSPAGAATTG